MPQLHFGISDDLDKALRVFAEARGLSMAAAIRLILHERLTTGDGGEPMQITVS
jgi:plasmid stability protein